MFQGLVADRSLDPAEGVATETRHATRYPPHIQAFFDLQSTAGNAAIAALASEPVAFTNSGPGNSTGRSVAFLEATMQEGGLGAFEDAFAPVPGLGPQAPPVGFGAEASGPTDQEIIDPRIDVAAQRAIFRLRGRDPQKAGELVGFVKTGELKGFGGDDLRMAALHAAELGTVRWELVPPGRDAAAVPGPEGSAPLGVYREQIRDDQVAMDAAAEVVHSDVVELQGKKGASPPGVCSCEPSISPCTTEQTKVLFKAATGAAQKAANAKSAIADYRAAPTDPKNEKTAKALQTHFLWTEALRQKRPLLVDVPSKVESLIDKILAAFSKPVCAGCADADPTKTEDGKKVSAFTMGSYVNTNCFSVMKPFYFADLDDEQRVKTVLHELAHNHGRVGDAAGYEGDSGYPGANTSISTNSADPYACFIRDVG